MKVKNSEWPSLILDFHVFLSKRAGHKLTNLKLAEELGVSVDSIYAWKGGTKRPDKTQKTYLMVKMSEYKHKGQGFFSWRRETMKRNPEILGR